MIGYLRHCLTVSKPGHYTKVSRKMQAPDILTPDKMLYPLNLETGCAPEQLWTCWRREKILALFQKFKQGQELIYLKRNLQH